MCSPAQVSRRNRILEKLGLFVRPSGFDEASCADFVSLLRDAPSTQSEIETLRSVHVDETTRRSLSLKVPEDRENEIVAYFESMKPAIETHFGVTLGVLERPHFLLYKPGAFFTPHRDRPRVTKLEVSDRQISMVLFLNHDYQGGELTFYELIDGDEWRDKGFPCEAAPGLFVAFRSDQLHEVTPVISGERFTIASWYA